MLEQQILSDVSVPVLIEPFCWQDLGWVGPPPDMTYFSMFWLKSGSACLESGSVSRRVKHGELVCLRTECRQTTIGEAVRGYHLRIDHDFLRTSYSDRIFAPLQEFLRRLTDPIVQVQFSAQGRSEAVWLVNRLLREDRTYPEDYLASIRLNLGQFLLLCYRQLRLQSDNTAKISLSGEHVIRALCDYIEEHLTEHFRLTDLARRAGYAPAYFSSLFNRGTGQGLPQYIGRKRIALAQELLHTTNTKVVQICYEVGFRDLAHFNRTFKNVVGITPNQYRELGQTTGDKVEEKN